jgi:predicted alpha/beta-fold hydrolase
LAKKPPEGQFRSGSSRPVCFQQRWPWIGPDLQTLRDTLHAPWLGPDQGQPRLVAVSPSEQLRVQVDPPLGAARGWVVAVHGLGGSAAGLGLRRLAATLQRRGFGVWRLNLRGAGGSRPLAPGTWSAACWRDVLPVLAAARLQAKGLPVAGIGLSLGGTVLLNALRQTADALDALICVSSPLDLPAAVQQLERPRNRFYQWWLLRRLVQQTLDDPFLPASERSRLAAVLAAVRCIRDFDSCITAPRWGYASAAAYYRQASPLQSLRADRCAGLAPTLLLHARDDPWVPAAAAEALASDPPAALQCCLPAHGGHNGFHGYGGSYGHGRGSQGSWSDQLAAEWLLDVLPLRV